MGILLIRYGKISSFVDCVQKHREFHYGKIRFCWWCMKKLKTSLISLCFLLVYCEENCKFFQFVSGKDCKFHRSVNNCKFCWFGTKISRVLSITHEKIKFLQSSSKKSQISWIKHGKFTNFIDLVRHGNISNFVRYMQKNSESRWSGIRKIASFVDQHQKILEFHWSTIKILPFLLIMCGKIKFPQFVTDICHQYSSMGILMILKIPYTLRRKKNAHFKKLFNC